MKLKKMLCCILAGIMLLSAVSALAEGGAVESAFSGASGELITGVATLGTGDVGNIRGLNGQKTLLNYCTNTVQDMNPFHQVITNAVVATLYMKLAYPDGQGGLVSDCCESIENVAPGEWRVKLYPDIVDQAGNPFTADDLVFCMNSTAEAGFSNSYADFGSIEKEDELTCLIKTSSPAKSSFYVVSAGTLLVTEESFNASVDQMSTTPVGFTPYKLTAFLPGSYADVEAVDNYWQKDASKISRHYEANVDVIHFVMLRDPAQKVAGLQTGDLNLVGGLDNATMQMVQNGNFKIEPQYNIDGNKALTFNMTEGTVCGDDINLRQAILHCINRQDWVDAFGAGRAVNSVIDKDYMGYNPEWDNMDYFVYDLDLAADYLSKSNYNGQSLRILANPGGDSQTSCEVLMASLEAIGIKSELVVREQATYGAAQYASNNEFDIEFLEVYATTHDAYDALAVAGGSAFSDVEGRTKYGWANPELIELCDNIADKGRTEENRDKIYQILTDNAAMMGTFVKAEYVVCDPAIDQVFSVSGISIPGSTHFSQDYSVFVK